jgi:hypothetical protein
MVVRAVLGVGREDAGTASGRSMMGRITGNAGSRGHHIQRFASDHYRLSWRVEYKARGCRHLLFRRSSRDTDRKGAERFAKRWKIAMPTEAAP